MFEVDIGVEVGVDIGVVVVVGVEVGVEVVAVVGFKSWIRAYHRSPTGAVMIFLTGRTWPRSRSPDWIVASRSPTAPRLGLRPASFSLGLSQRIQRRGSTSLSGPDGGPAVDPLRLL